MMNVLERLQKISVWIRMIYAEDECEQIRVYVISKHTRHYQPQWALNTLNENTVNHPNCLQRYKHSPALLCQINIFTRIWKEIPRPVQ